MLDPAVPEVEALLTAAATRRPAPATTPAGPPLPVEHALWLCACVTMDDAPIWLLYATAAGGFGWTEVPDGRESLDLVDARFASGDHVAPSEVLAWLRDADSTSLGDRGHEHRRVLEALAQFTTAGRPPGRA